MARENREKFFNEDATDANLKESSEYYDAAQVNTRSSIRHILCE